MRSFSLYRSILICITFFVLRPLTRGLYPPPPPMLHLHASHFHPSPYTILDSFAKPSPHHRITSTFSRGHFLRIGHASSGEYISMARVSASSFSLLLTTYSRSSPFIIAQAWVEASLPSLSFSSIFPLYLFSRLLAS